MSEGRNPLWEIADNLRATRIRVDLNELVEEALRAGVSFARADLEPILESGPHTRWQEPRVPRPALGFIAEMCKALQPRSAVSLYAGDGEAIETVIRAAHPVRSVAIEQAQGAVRIGQYLTRKLPVDWILGDPAREVQNPLILASVPDLIIANLPFGGSVVGKQLAVPGSRTIEVRDSPAHITLLEYAELLAEEGNALFLTTLRFLLDQRPASLRNVLTEVGLHLRAALTLPAGQLRPWTSMPALLVMLGRRDPGRVFLGELNDAQDRPRVLAENLVAGRDGAAPQLGVFVAPGKARPIDSVVASLEIEKLAKQSGYPRLLLGDIATVHVPKRDGEPFPHAQNEFYLPLVGLGPPRTEAPEKPTRNWAQVSLLPDAALRDYVVRYFGTKLGQRVRVSLTSGAIMPRLSRRDLASLELYLPDLSLQGKMIEAESQLLAHEADLTRQRQRLWETPRSLPQVQRKLRRLRVDDDLQH